MKRLPLLLATMGIALLLSAGVAFADTFNCIANRECIGTDGPDTLNGSTGPDSMDARQGDDELFGNNGDDVMDGDTFDAANIDTSTDGNDLLRGGWGFDTLAGYGGADYLRGGGNDDLIGAVEASENEGEDFVYGGLGNDIIEAIDGVKDTIDCGEGTTDLVFFDGGGVDTVADNCELKSTEPPGGNYVGVASSTTGKVSAEKVSALRAR